MNQDKIKSTLLEALRRAGSLIKSSLSEAKDVHLKAELSLVTKTDTECDKIITDTIKKEFPDHAFLTEESPAQGNSPYRWIIDPVDGTTNFAHSFPVCCVSIGFEANGQMEMGGVYDPFRDELFFARKGHGATLNDEPIHVSKTASLTDALVATGFPYDRRVRADVYLAAIKTFIMKVQGIRRCGAAALDLCYVACGRFDAFWEQKLNAWDKAAGMLIVTEAGGMATNFAGTSLQLEDNCNLASNGLIHKKMLEILGPYQN